MTTIEEFLREQGRDYFVAGDDLPVETLQQLIAEYRQWERETHKTLNGTFLTATVANQVLEWMRGSEDGYRAVLRSAVTVSVEPGDVVVFKSDKRMSLKEQHDALRLLEDLFPGHRSAVIDEGGDIEVIRPPKEVEEE